MGMENENEVGSVPVFARKKSAADELEYAAEVAEDKDLVYLVENTCIHCNRLMNKSEVKILPPSYIQERDPYVSKGIVRKRLMCVDCYNAIRSSAREKIQFDGFRNSGKAQYLRAAVGRFLANR